MRGLLLAVTVTVIVCSGAAALAQEDKKTDDLKPADFPASMAIQPLDDMTNRLLDWQYRYLWDDTRAP